MASPLARQAIGLVARRLPLLRRLPIVRLLLLGELVLLARDHIERLTPRERRRLVVLIRDARGRPDRLTGRRRQELEELIAKAEPKVFASAAAGKLLKP